MNPWAITGAQINSALYILLVFAAGALSGHRASEILAAATAGAAYLSYLCQAREDFLAAGSQMRQVAAGFNIAAIALGAVGGLALLF